MRRLALIPVALLLLAGCGGPEKALVGKWNFDAGAAPAGQNAQTAASLAQFSKGNTLEFKADKTFTWTMMGKSAQGTITMADKTATLNFTNIDGQDVSKIKAQTPDAGTMTAVLSDDGKKLTLQPKSGGGNGMSFTKASS